MIYHSLPDRFQLHSASYKRQWLRENDVVAPPPQGMSRAEQRMRWLLRHIHGMTYKATVAWEEETVDLFVETFPEALKTLRVYILGPNSSPMLNRAATRARDRGYLSASHLGNMDARSYNQRTWCRYWKLTPAGCVFVEDLIDAESQSTSGKSDR